MAARGKGDRRPIVLPLVGHENHANDFHFGGKAGAEALAAVGSG